MRMFSMKGDVKFELRVSDDKTTAASCRIIEPGNVDDGDVFNIRLDEYNTIEDAEQATFDFLNGELYVRT